MARRTREDAPIKTAEVKGMMDLPVFERLQFYISKNAQFGTPVSQDKIIQNAVDQYLRKYGMC